MDCDTGFKTRLLKYRSGSTSGNVIAILGLTLSMTLTLAASVDPPTPEPGKPWFGRPGANHFRGIGESCVEKSYWEREQKGTCDDRRGFSCQNYPEYGGFVCACSSPFVYDPHGDECRRRLGGTCPHPSLSYALLKSHEDTLDWDVRGIWPRPSQIKKPQRPLAWYDKCQENAECAIGQGISGNPAGICQCKPGFGLSYGGDFCESF